MASLAAGYASRDEDLALARVAATALEALSERLWGARQYKLALQARADAKVEREYAETEAHYV